MQGHEKVMIDIVMKTYEVLSRNTLQLIEEIHKSRDIQDNLIEKTAFWKALIQTIPDLIWLKDRDGKYLACNKRFEDFFGHKEEDIVGKTDYDFVDKELADMFRANDNKAIEIAGKLDSRGIGADIIFYKQ